MPKPWRLTRQAEASLIEIARWTVETFGPRQAAAYEDDLISTCRGIAAGTALSQDCRRLIDPDLAEDLRFARAGQHFVVFVEDIKQVIIIDFLHSRADLPRRLANLPLPKGGGEAMLNRVVPRINSFIETLNAALVLLPEWATGEGGVRIGILDPVELGRIGNPFEGAATAAGAAAADAFSAALSRTYLEPPDLGLGTMADDARARADGYREAAGMLADAAGRPLASWQALKDAVTGTGTEAQTALADAAASADALTSRLNDTATAADGAGGAAGDAGAAAAEGADTALTGWQAVTAALADYAAKARDIGGDR